MLQETSEENKSPGEPGEESALNRRLRSLSRSLLRSDRSNPSTPSSTTNAIESEGIPTVTGLDLQEYFENEDSVNELLEAIPTRRTT